MKKFLLIIFSIFILVPNANSFEDCIITADGRLTNIKIEHNDIIDVFPLITIMNEKNTLIIHPLKKGNTKFSIMKNNKDTFVFDVKVLNEVTIINPVEGFHILSIDYPPETNICEIDLDEPPQIDYFSKDLPPALRGIN